MPNKKRTCPKTGTYGPSSEKTALNTGEAIARSEEPALLEKKSKALLRGKAKVDKVGDEGLQALRL